MSDTEEQETQNNTELRDHLHQMEAKVRKLRESRNNHNDQANRFADQRNAIQGQYKEHKEKLDLAIAEVRAVRAEQNVHKERRDAVQAQIRDLIGVSKSRRGDQNNKNNASIEFNKLSSEVTSLERIFETKGGMSPKKEKETMEKIKQMRRKMAELEPLVAELQLIKVDISNRDEAINTLKAEADDAHKQFVACLEKAKEMSKELDELFGHRNFLKGEGDRFHKEFVACKEKANEVHERIVELMKEVNEARDKLKIAREERESWIVDHNESVTKLMKTGADDPKVADSMVDQLLKEGTLTFGGTMSGDRQGLGAKRGKSSKKKSMKRFDMTASRGRK
ncbi:MAG: hypothetical protein CMA91_06240 [Euryarchaeota archaeon]|nr:hypothetical protein [Euryarchaeota archaeon]|tara:strand:- start:1672 stop:2682 length:1011 start_codon:yes stop_codon:yes gene_type:complete